MRHFLLVSFVLLSSVSGQANQVIGADYSFVYEKLLSGGSSKKFVSSLKSRVDPSIRDRVIRLNLLGFRAKPDYSGHISDAAVEACRKFLSKHEPAFRTMAKRTGVDKEVVAALLWVETRHGKRLGKYAVPSVYVNLAMADHPEMVAAVLAELKSEDGISADEYTVLMEKVKSVSIRKAEWAIAQLRALEQIQKRKLTDIFAIRGSYAGAFGIPQFIPSSYLDWVTETKRKRRVDLFKKEEAIHSVGDYLKKHGWGSSREAQEAALFAYNKSTDYVTTILTLAAQVRVQEAPAKARTLSAAD